MGNKLRERGMHRGLRCKKQRIRALPIEGQGSTNRFVNHHPHRPNVGRGSYRGRAKRLLGAHIRWRPHHDTGRCAEVIVGIKVSRDTEIEDANPAVFLNKYILGFEVAVHDL